MIELGEHKLSVHGKVRMKCLDRQDDLRNKGFEKIVLSHFGEFTIDFISEISERVEEYMVSSGDQKIVIRRMFTILMEGMKYVREHGLHDERGRQIGYLIIAQSPEKYKLEVANLVRTEDLEGLKEYIAKLNSYGENELRDKYNEVLDKEFLNTEGSAGLGMIITRLKTGDTIHFESDTIDSGMCTCSFMVSLNRS
jgi:predicted DNA-binding protein (UPF0278 family)